MYQPDRDWSDSYVSQVIRILMQLLPYLVELGTASIEMDTKYATDFTIKLKGGTIAVRLRRPDCKFRDWTIRSARDNGVKTELAKLREGHGFRYFYGWIDDNDNIAEWVLIDLDKVRETGLLDKPRKPKPNGDGTYFIPIRIRELFNADCLIIYQLKNKFKVVREVDKLASPIDGIKRAKQGYNSDGSNRSNESDVHNLRFDF